MNQTVASAMERAKNSLQEAANQLEMAAGGYSPSEAERRDLDDLTEKVDRLLNRTRDFISEH